MQSLLVKTRQRRCFDKEQENACAKSHRKRRWIYVMAPPHLCAILVMTPVAFSSSQANLFNLFVNQSIQDSLAIASRWKTNILGHIQTCPFGSVLRPFTLCTLCLEQEFSSSFVKTLRSSKVMVLIRVFKDTPCPGSISPWIAERYRQG